MWILLVLVFATVAHAGPYMDETIRSIARPRQPSISYDAAVIELWREPRPQLYNRRVVPPNRLIPTDRPLPRIRQEEE